MKINIIRTKAPYSRYLYEVEFKDKNGRSSLARTNKMDRAIVFQNKFMKDLEKGRLLKPFKNAFK